MHFCCMPSGQLLFFFSFSFYFFPFTKIMVSFSRDPLLALLHPSCIAWLNEKKEKEKISANWFFSWIIFLLLFSRVNLHQSKVILIISPTLNFISTFVTFQFHLFIVVLYCTLFHPLCCSWLLLRIENWKILHVHYSITHIAICNRKEENFFFMHMNEKNYYEYVLGIFLKKENLWCEVILYIWKFLTYKFDFLHHSGISN